MGLADLHIHSIYSYDGTAAISAILKYASEVKHLDVLAITDHDTLSGVPEALDLAPYYGVEIVPGCEISTADGHLLALFIEKQIKPGLSLENTIGLIGDQGGICVAAHPMAIGVNSLTLDKIRTVIAHPDLSKVMVGVEVFNGGLVYTRSNHSVLREVAGLPVAHVGNSDAHILHMIGQGATYFAGKTVKELRYALENRMTSVRAGRQLNGFDVISSYLPRLLIRKFGWAPSNLHLGSPIRLERFAQKRIQQVNQLP